MKLKNDGILRFEADGLRVEAWKLALEIDSEVCAFEAGRVEIEDSQPSVIKKYFRTP